MGLPGASTPSGGSAGSWIWSLTPRRCAAAQPPQSDRTLRSAYRSGPGAHPRCAVRLRRPRLPGNGITSTSGSLGLIPWHSLPASRRPDRCPRSGGPQCRGHHHTRRCPRHSRRLTDPPHLLRRRTPPAPAAAPRHGEHRVSGVARKVPARDTVADGRALRE
jgi:hypothetical protein